VLTARLCEFAADTTWVALPSEVRERTVLALTNWVGCAVGGAAHGACDAAAAGLAALGSDGSCRVFGRADRWDPQAAATLSCLASAVDAFDDTHLATITHPTGPVAAALFAVADSSGRAVSGAEFLAALAVGIEISLRLAIGLKTDPAFPEGWWLTGVTGVVGAAAAAGKLLGLTVDDLPACLGIAASQAAGVRATHQSAASPFVPAFAARNALVAAYSARAGLGCNPDILEARNGLFAVLAPTADTDAVTAGLGKNFAIRELTFKPYPGAIVAHPVIDACLAVARTPDFRIEAVRGLRLRVHPSAARLAGRIAPTTPFEAQHSLTHWAAACLVTGRATPAEMTEEFLERADIRSLQDCVTVEVDDTLVPDQAVAVADLDPDAGSALTIRIEHAFGSVDRPMTAADVEAKFLAQVGARLDTVPAAQLLDRCRSVADLADVRGVLDAGTADRQPSAAAR
jgi:2-methylcitrate dehydratase PrpD